MKNILIVLMFLVPTISWSTTSIGIPDYGGCARSIDGIDKANDLLINIINHDDASRNGIMLVRKSSNHISTCLEMAFYLCDDNDGFIRPPPSIQSYKTCKSVFDNEYRKIEKSNNLWGLYWVSFVVPIDIFAPYASTLTLTVDDSQPTENNPLPVNEKGDAIYMMQGGHHNSKYVCKSISFPDINDINRLPMSSLYEFNIYESTGKEQATCQIIANQPFILIVHKKHI